MEVLVKTRRMKDFIAAAQQVEPRTALFLLFWVMLKDFMFIVVCYCHFFFFFFFGGGCFAYV